MFLYIKIFFLVILVIAIGLAQSCCWLILRVAPLWSKKNDIDEVYHKLFSLLSRLWLEVKKTAKTIYYKHLSREPNQKLREEQCKEYYDSVVNELQIQYQGKIDDMEAAAKKLRENFEKKKESAKILGVDLENSELSALVKGREFEVFFARLFDQYDDVSIKSWTPDKGIAEGIHVETNGDPDFCIEITDGNDKKVIPVECKYRSSYPKGEKVSWVKYYQYKRYCEYEEKSGCPVMMLVGVDGDAKKPDFLFMTTLSDFYKKSQYDERPKFKNLYSNLNDIVSCQVEKENIVNRMKRY